eukprot:gnl/Carplike_NY0171/4467_a6066_376.p1 GENE.gnl/Carplike_NY0171/4467_a6066_376~~gnl/Carplike_NY0171/4467_a6066_376.p1  ORF type:complete len:302 (+),score=55.07 gnl/Carplike_NY0171/4467_a6066_376:86-991(+)
MESFYQKSGRVGRDGKQAIAVLYYSRKEAQRILKFVQSGDSVGPSGCGRFEARVSSYRSVVDMCCLCGCRRRSILEYFNDPNLTALVSHRRCCDYCNNPEKVERIITGVCGLDGRKLTAQPHRSSSSFEDDMDKEESTLLKEIKKKKQRDSKSFSFSTASELVSSNHNKKKREKEISSVSKHLSRPSLNRTKTSSQSKGTSSKIKEMPYSAEMLEKWKTRKQTRDIIQKTLEQNVAARRGGVLSEQSARDRIASSLEARVNAEKGDYSVNVASLMKRLEKLNRERLVFNFSIELSRIGLTE